ncbi:MAG: beta-ketoacyl-ACP synthase II [Nitrospirota bacterium]|nr:beta-ketoacyl-ACP synthase II [Nitrospirota bacterium]
MKHRVAITGLGLLTPLGNDTTSTWNGLVEGRSGIGAITRFGTSDIPVHIAGEIKAFDPLQFIAKKEARQLDLFLQYALASASMAVEDAGIVAADLGNAAVLIGSARGGLPSTEESVRNLIAKGANRVSPHFVLASNINLASTLVARRYGIRGPAFGYAAACATGAVAIGEAFQKIRNGEREIVIAGASDAALCPVALAGYASARVLSRRNHEPARASRPFDRDRDGFVMSEGAGILILERMDRAMERGARIYAEISGYGSSCDAWSMVHPHPEGDGAVAAMEGALQDACSATHEVGYINAHGTGTMLNDRIESHAIRKVFGPLAEKLAVSSSKSMLGHMLGAAGAVEVAVTILALYHGIIPPTINLDTPDPQCTLDYVPRNARRAKVGAALSNSFGFGGTNVSLLFKRY